MRVEVWQVLTPDDLREGKCCVCWLRFQRSVAQVSLLTDARMELGEVCLACLERGPEHIERRICEQAELARITAEEMERAASESVEDCPSVEEYRMLERAICKPRYGSFEEADRAMGYE
jgi:hypothetical protein